MAQIGGWRSIAYMLGVARKTGWGNLFAGMRSKNACKTCALGMGGQKGGMRNELNRWPEFCKKSVQAMASDMQPAISPDFFAEHPLTRLQSMTSQELEASGRLSFPVILRKNETHFIPLHWDEAFETLTQKMQSIPATRSFFYFSGRSSNEAGFLLQILARVYGTNHVNNCSFYCHQASGVGLTGSLGTGTATVKLEDVEGADLLILLGGNPTSNHPRLMTSLMHMRRKGGKVVVVNPLWEPGLARFHVPSDWRSLLFGTRIADHYVQPHIGGDIALLLGIAKAVKDAKAHNLNFIEQHTRQWSEFEALLENTSWEEIILASGVDQKEIEKLAQLYSQSEKCVFAWTMGLTHHLHGVANVQTLTNLALMRSMVGKPHSGLLPLRGHSNVQGMGSMGVTPTLKKAVFDQLTALGLELPKSPGHDTMASIEAAARGEFDFALCLGGNLLGSNPDFPFAKKALGRVGMCTYLSTTLNTGHVHGTGEETLILPVCARDEEDQATTQESMFNYVRMSDGGPKRLAGTRTEVAIISELGARLFGEGSPIDWKQMRRHQNIRTLIAKTVPGMAGLSELDRTKKEFTIPGRIYDRPQFSTPDGRAVFRPHSIPQTPEIGNAQLRLMTIRSEGQFNTVVYEDEDRFRGVKGRDVILINPIDMRSLGFTKNQRIRVRSATGTMDQIRVWPSGIKTGNAAMYFPEANQLIGRQTDPQSKTPAFKSTLVSLVATHGVDRSAAHGASRRKEL